MTRAYAAIAAVILLCSARSYALSEEDIFALAKPAESGDRNAIRKLFALYSEVHASFYEDVDQILGHVARLQPQMFLEELKRSGAQECTNLGNTLDLTDQTEKQLEELRARQSALRAVTSKRLIPLRDSCIKDLNDPISTYAARYAAELNDAKANK